MFRPACSTSLLDQLARPICSTSLLDQLARPACSTGAGGGQIQKTGGESDQMISEAQQLKNEISAPRQCPSD